MQTFDTQERKKLEHSAKMHLVHWLAIGFSLILTIAAWYFAKTQLQERISRQFDREADQVINLIMDRMKNYEDALWSGVALFDTLDEDISYQQWLDYSDSIQIEEKYPGVNGIGVIYALQPNQVEEYLITQRQSRPDFRIHPPHEKDLFYPITYIEPR